MLIWNESERIFQVIFFLQGPKDSQLLCKTKMHVVVAVQHDMAYSFSLKTSIFTQ